LTTTLDVITARVVVNYIKEFRSQGKCIIFSTHQMAEAEKLCDEIAIIHKGKILSSGTLAELQEKFQEQDLEEIFFKLVKVRIEEKV